MANIFEIQGLGALSEWNGQFASASANQAFQSIASLGSNSVELTTRIWTQSGTSNAVFADDARTESDANLLAGFRAAQTAKLSVVFKASLSALNGTPVSGLAPADVGSFFASYTAEIVHLATIAQAGGVKTFAIGNEMSSLSGQQYRGYWTDLITAVREVYHGELTYAAATDEASRVGFWDQLDVIGVNTYPPLTSSMTPTVQDLVNAWSEVPFDPYYAAAFGNKSPVDFLHSLSEQYGRPVLMTEVGYRSVDGTAIRPGGWTTAGTPDLGEQADAYKAFFQVWTAHGGSWLKGVELWQWDLDNQYSSTGYSVMGKPAAEVVSQYFHGNGFTPGLTVPGSPGDDNIDLGRGNDVVDGGLGNDVILGGAGNDVITGGPGTTTRFATTTITLIGYGTVVGGVGAQARILVNGQQVSGLFEFKPAVDASDYQTMTVTFDNPGTITSLDIDLFNATPGRALHVKAISINGVAVGPDAATNASSPGTFDLYVRNIHFDATGHQDWFFGATADNDRIDGGPGNDVITGGIGNDVIDGGQGTDTAVFAGNISDYDFSFAGSRITVTDHVANRGGTDVLTNIEFLKFADTTTSVLDITVGGQAADSASHITVRHADGSRDVYTSGVAGKDYVSQHTVTDSAGHSVLIENFRGDGVVVLKQVVDASGVITLDQYDGLGHVVQETVTQKDGSYLQSAYAPDGALATQTFRHADGSRDIYTYGIVGKDYTSQHVVNDPSGHTVLVEQFHSDGPFALRQTMDAGAADGAPVTEISRHFDGPRDFVPGVTVASTTANDVFKNAGGDTFVFKQASGHDTINHFGAADATGHDAIQADSTVAADAAHPSVHISGQDTVFDHGHDASVALPDAVMPLTWHDFLIV